MCPGDASHFELQPRQGYKDMMVYHPGLMSGSSRENTEEARNWAVLGCGRVSIPHRCVRGGRSTSQGGSIARQCCGRISIPHKCGGHGGVQMLQKETSAVGLIPKP